MSWYDINVRDLSREQYRHLAEFRRQIRRFLHFSETTAKEHGIERLSVTAAVAVKPLTNAQVIAMVKSGMEDDTVAQTIRAAKAVNFDLSAAGQQELTSNGASSRVLTAMKARAERKPATAKPAAAK